MRFAFCFFGAVAAVEDAASMLQAQKTQSHQQQQELLQHKLVQRASEHGMSKVKHQKHKAELIKFAQSEEAVNLLAHLSPQVRQVLLATHSQTLESAFNGKRKKGDSKCTHHLKEERGDDDTEDWCKEEDLVKLKTGSTTEYEFDDDKIKDYADDEDECEDAEDDIEDFCEDAEDLAQQSKTERLQAKLVKRAESAGLTASAAHKEELIKFAKSDEAVRLFAHLNPKVKNALLATKTETLDAAFEGKRKKGDSKCTHHLKEERGDDDTEDWCKEEDLVKLKTGSTTEYEFDDDKIKDYADDEDECEDAEDDIEDFCEDAEDLVQKKRMTKLVKKLEIRASHPNLTASEQHKSELLQFVKTPEAAKLLKHLSPKVRNALLATKTDTLDAAFEGKRKKGDSKCTHHLKEERGDDDTEDWCKEEDLVKLKTGSTTEYEFDDDKIKDYADDEDECEDAEDDIEDFCEDAEDLGQLSKAARVQAKLVKRASEVGLTKSTKGKQALIEFAKSPEAAQILAKMSPKIRQTLLATHMETLDAAFVGKRKKGDSKCTHHLKEERGDDDTEDWCKEEDLVKLKTGSTTEYEFDDDKIKDYADDEDECEDAEDDIEDFCEDAED